ncbi:unnamed protein product [Gongylonema pulchrum]|uniref:DNA helicase n=1 Tax=Gongylonema pulchrum TaxID=637853 RepID=A0A183DNK3_9BILA|nr:unnamed protein product [Gongylonema pulchrum]
MPLFDMAEAVSRGDIIVDEVDALNAVNSGKLSELETARFSPLVAEHSRRQSAGNGTQHIRAEALPFGLAGGDVNGASAGGSDDEHAWDNVLVDEVDFVHAAERGRIARKDLPIPEHRSSGTSAAFQRMLNDNTGDFADSSQEENDWSRVLVDEVDILHAAEQGSRISNRSECRLSFMHREDGGRGTERNVIHKAAGRSTGWTVDANPSLIELWVLVTTDFSLELRNCNKSGSRKL